ncbi:hypothetical protein [Sulfuracidifex metallicus]|uniref:hypothetical protein n=1 Tax=Sulfuracidifex metallicus TaxID=47303 RepID=UPI000A594755|nr:hypothetical protein [Sulfuracidifex metallicus]WOE50113.1 hypothetical protein RQ359_001616 [Sulfuracidifex metallicus DSM 6482 = JCM 9184]
MARRMCPQCKKVDEIEVIHEGNVITKKCPHCGFIYITYKVERQEILEHKE